MRGQALVLFALTLLLLALAALFTLGLGVRIKERMELQTLADTAAYDNAVATARTFNSLAVVNRTEWSLLVAQSAGQSYLSWATAYRGVIDGLADAMAPGIGACGSVRGLLKEERMRVDLTFAGREPSAFRELQRLANVQQELLRFDSRRDYQRLERLVGRGLVTTAVLDEARGALGRPIERVTPVGVPGSLQPSRRYLGQTFDAAGAGFDVDQLSRDCFTGVACDIDGPGFQRWRWNWTIMRHQHELYMGTRGDPFTTDRLGGSAIARQLERALRGRAPVRWSGSGSSYRSSVIYTHGADFALGPGGAMYPRMMPDSAMSDDHGVITVDAPGCNAAVQVDVLLKNGAVADENEHAWTTVGSVSDDFGRVLSESSATRRCPFEHQASHQLPDLGQQHAWPLLIDFNDQRPHAQGLVNDQPTNLVMLERDYRRGQPDPWDLRFVFAGQRYDSGPRDLQRAVARGIAYYHRGRAWQEPPNFVNPFWQATLVSTAWEAASP